MLPPPFVSLCTTEVSPTPTCLRPISSAQTEPQPNKLTKITPMRMNHNTTTMGLPLAKTPHHQHNKGIQHQPESHTLIPTTIQPPTWAPYTVLPHKVNQFRTNSPHKHIQPKTTSVDRTNQANQIVTKPNTNLLEMGTITSNKRFTAITKTPERREIVTERSG